MTPSPSPSFTPPLALALALALFVVLLPPPSAALPFVDVSARAGLVRHAARLKKYGGAAVADFDGDGWLDLLYCHHDSRRAELYFNNGNGTFTLLSSWRYFYDMHSFSPFPSSPLSKRLSFFSSVGGNYGRNPRSPALLQVSASRAVVQRADIRYGAGRGRSVTVVPLGPKPRKWNDIVILNAKPNDAARQKNFVATVTTDLNVSNRRLSLLERDRNPYGTVTDIDGDGRMELVTFSHLTLYRVTAYFRVEDVSDAVLPRTLTREGVRAVAELDFDNDGFMDLYIARTVTNDLRWLRGQLGAAPDDALLRNVGGRYYEDVSGRMGIPVGGESTGVTAGDFDNDGWVDLFVQQYAGADRLLLNDGGQRFTEAEGRERGDIKGRRSKEVGDHPVAFDYDGDGTLDLLVGYGDWFDVDKGGQFHLLRNVISSDQVRASANWVKVRVGSSGGGHGVSALHAAVSVRTGARGRMWRRVGSPGTATSQSFVNVVHFGLGGRRWARAVTVRWTDGSSETKWAIRAGQTVKVGYFPE